MSEVLETKDIEAELIEGKFISSFDQMAEIINGIAEEKGWWDEPEDIKKIREIVSPLYGDLEISADLEAILNRLADRNDGEMICLMHSELSEWLEGIRHGNGPSEHIPEFTCAEEEAADVIIRIMDTGKKRNMRIAEALIAKVLFNEGRPYKHGGKAF